VGHWDDSTGGTGGGADQGWNAGPLPWYWLTTRSYDPQLRRFLQPDPSSRDGVRSYAYCHDDPVNYADPSGLDEGEGGDDLGGAGAGPGSGGGAAGAPVQGSLGAAYDAAALPAAGEYQQLPLFDQMMADGGTNLVDVAPTQPLGKTNEATSASVGQSVSTLATDNGVDVNTMEQGTAASNGGAKRGPKLWPDGLHNQTIARRINELLAEGMDHFGGGSKTEERIDIHIPDAQKPFRRVDITMRQTDGTLYREQVRRTLDNGCYGGPFCQDTGEGHFKVETSPYTLNCDCPPSTEGPGGPYSHRIVGEGGKDTLS